MALVDYVSTGTPPVIESIKSVSHAVEVFEKIAATDTTLRVYRGHADKTWPVSPSIFRDDVNAISHEYKLVRDLIALYPREFDEDRSMFDKLVRMQHFGLRTRLMDVSKNPLPALYFAVEEGNDDKDGAVIVFDVPEERIKYYDSDSVSCIANLANLNDEEKESVEETKSRTVKEFNRINAVDRLFQFIRSEKPSFRPKINREDLFKPYFVHPKMNNKRIIAQNGAFIIYGLKRSKGPSFTKTIKVRRVEVPRLLKAPIRQTLQRLGYDDSTIYPEIDRSARQLIRRYS